MTIASHALLVVVANGCLFAAGAGITRAFGVWSRPSELRHAMGLALIGGIAAYGVAAQALYVLGFSLRLWQGLVVCALLAMTGAFGRRKPTQARPNRAFARFEIAAAALAAVMLLLLGVESLFQPLAAWDAWAIWTPRAHALVVMNGLDPHVLGNVAYRSWHLDYPLFVPAVEAFAFRFMGVDYRVIHLEQWFFLLGFAVAYVDLLRPRVRPAYMWAGLLAILWAPKVGGELLTANADVPLAILVGLAGISAFIWITESSRISLALFSLFAAAATATKAEGTYLIAVVFALIVAYVLRRSRRDIWATAAAGAGVLVGIVPWRAWVAVHHLPSSYSVSAALHGPGIHQHSRGPIATLVLVGELFSPREWLLLMPLAVVSVAVLAVAGLRDRWRLLLGCSLSALVATAIAISLEIPGPSFVYPWRASDSLLLALLGVGGAVFCISVARAGGLAIWALGVASLMTATFVAVYVLTPYPFQWHLGTSSSRIVVGPVFFLAALTPLLLERATARRG